MSDLAPNATELAEAAEWFVRLSSAEASARDQAAWQAWHERSPTHRAAWQRVERLQGLLAQAPNQASRTLLGAQQAPRRRMAMVLGMVALVSLVHWAAPWAPSNSAEWIVTAPGERRELRLPDGGQLLLGSSTRVAVRYGADSRDIELAQGSLRLMTAPDPQGRPLRVLARDGVVRPLGTRFTLEQGEHGSLLAVQEHAVELSPAGRGAVIRLDAGQKLRFSRQSVGRPEPSDWTDEAWVRGVLVAVDMPLQQFVEALRQQSGREIACDPDIAMLRVSGSYLVDDPERSLATLAGQLPVRLERGAQSWRLRAP